MTGDDTDNAAADSDFSLTSLLQRLLGQSNETQSAADEAQSDGHETQTTSRETTKSTTQTTATTSKTPEERQLYRLIPNYSVSGADDPYIGSDLVDALRDSPVTKPSQLIIGMFNGGMRTLLHTPLTQKKVRQTVVQSKTTATIDVDQNPAPEALSTTEMLETNFDLTVEPDATPRTFRYVWESAEPFPLSDRSLSITDVIERLNDLPCFVLFTVDIAPKRIRKGRVSGYKVRLEAQVVVGAECTPETFAYIEQTIRSVFSGTPLSPTLYDLDDDPPFQTVSPDTLAALTTLPSPTELHRLDVTGTDSPIDAADLSSPSSYLDPSLPLGWVADSQKTLSHTPVGYGQSRQPVTLLRVNPPRPETADVNAPRSEFLANIRALAATPYPVFVLHTRPTQHEYLQAIDAELESNDEVSIYYRTDRTYRSRLGTRTECDFDPALVNRLLTVITNYNSVTLIDLSESDTPRVDLSSFVAALEQALRHTPDMGQSVACGVAINDAGTMLYDDIVESLSGTSALTSRANVLLNCQYPVGTSANRGATPGNRTTAQQTELLEMLITEVADGTLFDTSPQVLKLLDRIDLDDDVRETCNRIESQHNLGWLWYDRTAPTTQPIVSALRAQTDDSERPGAAEELLEIYGPVPSTLGAVFDLSTQKIRWPDYEQPDRGSEFSSGTQSEQKTVEPAGGGQPDTRIARPAQTDDDALPPGARFDADSDTYICQECSARYDPTQEGLHRVCNCCSKSPALVDRDALRCLPPIDIKLSPAEIEASPLSAAQLTFVRACYLAKQFAFDPVFQFDPLTDSMRQIVTDLGLETDTVEEVLETTVEGQGIVTKQATTTPHTVYNVTATGRKQIAESIEGGIDFGPGIGDLNESMLHHIGVVYLCLYLEAEYGTADGRTVKHYHKLETGEVVDAVVLDAAGDIVIAAEMECHNNDVGGESSSARSTYEKLVALDVEEAIWVFETSEHWEAATDTLAGAHQDPMSDIEFRADGYSRSYISKEPALTYPGMTEALTLSTLVSEVGYPYGLYDRDLSRFATA